MLRPTSASLLTTLALLALPLAACGDDEDTAPPTTATTTTVAETPAEWLARVQVECEGGDPGFDQFLADHAEPTAEDWAGFLPEPIEMVQTNRSCIADSNPPADVQEEVDGVLAAMDVVIADMQTALAAAEAEDLDGVDAALTKMNNGDVEAIDTAVQTVVAAVAEQ